MSCAKNTTETVVRTVHDYCLIAKGITYSKIKPTQQESAANLYDTPETVEQIVNHDLQYEAVCKEAQPTEAPERG